MYGRSPTCYAPASIAQPRREVASQPEWPTGFASWYDANIEGRATGLATKKAEPNRTECNSGVEKSVLLHGQQAVHVLRRFARTGRGTGEAATQATRRPSANSRAVVPCLVVSSESVPAPPIGVPFPDLGRVQGVADESTATPTRAHRHATRRSPQLSDAQSFLRRLSSCDHAACVSRSLGSL